ncbi:MAG: rod shape-determining protein MreD [Piscirickettsiaceae bacterium]|nr:MAG: rod shape-determining protein MreD [Piscirickettsiaceae bacterium]
MNKNTSVRFTIFATLFLSLCISIAPLPNVWSAISPQWTLLTLLYWSINAPNKVSVGTGWVTGILFDVLTNSLIGQHALIFSLVAYFGPSVQHRMKNHHIWQQATLLFIFLFVLQAINYVVTNMSKDIDNSMLFWSSVMSSVLCWPLLFATLRRTHRQSQFS